MSKVGKLKAAFEKGRSKKVAKDEKCSFDNGAPKHNNQWRLSTEQKRSIESKAKFYCSLDTADFGHNRTRIGSPKIGNRKSFTTEDLDLFNKTNDGFPVPNSSSSDEEKNGTVHKPNAERRTRSLKKEKKLDFSKRRSQSLSNLNGRKNKPKVAKKPEFLKKLTTGKGLPSIPLKHKNQYNIEDHSKTDNGVNSTKSGESSGTDVPQGVKTVFPYLPRSANKPKPAAKPHHLCRIGIEVNNTIANQSSSTSDFNTTERNNSNLQSDQNKSNSSESNQVNENGLTDSEINNKESDENKHTAGPVFHPYENILYGGEQQYNDNVYDNMTVEGGYMSKSATLDSDDLGLSPGARRHLNDPDFIARTSQWMDDWPDDDDDFFSSFSESEGEDEIQAIQASQSEASIESESEPVGNKLYKIAMELLTTERAYVKRLKLVDQVFHFRVTLENQKHNMFPNDVVTQMFSNIKSIYQFHNEHMLPQIEERMAKWGEIEKLGDLMKKFAPFLKLYTDYVKNFDNAMSLINHWAEKSPRFAEIMQEIQKTPECGMLTLQHHMLEPIQRVPRYELLLRDYIKKLPEDSPDLDDSKKAIELVSTAASHSNEAMKKIDQFRKLQEISASLHGAVPDLINPTRVLVKEGPVVKISARSGQHQDRYMFLFNDILLLCSEQVMGLGQSYKLRAKLDVDGMLIFEGDNLATENTFYVRSKQKTIELHLPTYEEKEEWQSEIAMVVNDLAKRKKSLKPARSIEWGLNSEEFELGKQAPRWIKDDEATMCMRCKAAFTLLFRRHHCRACGYVVCGKCSNYKFWLQFDEQVHRVCGYCYQILSGKGVAEDDDKTKAKTEEVVKKTKTEEVAKKTPTHLDVRAGDDSVLGGYLTMSNDHGKSWNKRYFAVKKDFVLYSFKANQDMRALTSMPLPGFTVSEPSPNDPVYKMHVFKLQHKWKEYFFQADSEAQKIRWKNVLDKVVQLELPDQVSNVSAPEES